MVVDNASCAETKALLREFQAQQVIHAVVTLPVNLGTAYGINVAWKRYSHSWDEIVGKLDNDIKHWNGQFRTWTEGWADWLEEAIRRESKLGVVGLKRLDCIEHPNHPEAWYRSEYVHLKRGPGQLDLIVERVHHVMGSCCAFSPAWRREVGYLRQPGLYGFDDSLASVASESAGLWNAFLTWLPIQHLDVPGTDPGADPYTLWKRHHSGRLMAEYNATIQGYKSGRIPLYYAFEETHHDLTEPQCKPDDACAQHPVGTHDERVDSSGPCAGDSAQPVAG